MEKSEGEKINRRLRLYEQGQVSRARKKERDCKFYTVIRSQKEINKNGEKVTKNERFNNYCYRNQNLHPIHHREAQKQKEERPRCD